MMIILRIDFDLTIHLSFNFVSSEIDSVLKNLIVPLNFRSGMNSLLIILLILPSFNFWINFFMMSLILLLSFSFEIDSVLIIFTILFR